MIDERHVFGRRFRELADRFPSVDGRHEHELLDEAGGLVIASYHRG
jgi:hypothetical protein